MKKIIIVISLLVFSVGLIAQRGPFIEPSGTTIICSGGNILYQILAFEEGDQFEWQEEISGSWISISVGAATINVHALAEELSIKKIRCKVLHLNGQSSITDPVLLHINPLPKLTIDMTIVCQNEISIFSSNQTEGVGNWLWILNGSDSSYYHTPEYLITSSGSQSIYLEYTDYNACSTSLSDSFKVPSSPNIEVKKWFNSACGDSHRSIEVTNYDPDKHQLDLYCLDNGELVDNAIRSFEIDNNVVEILFNRFEATRELELVLVVTDPSTNCSINLNYQFLLYMDRAPEAGELVMKPNTSYGLVFYVHKYDNEVSQLEFEWGYTWKDSGIQVTEATGDRDYFDFGSLQNDKIYWVYVYFKDGCQCKTINELNQN